MNTTQSPHTASSAFTKLQTMVIAALLCAIAIVIPMISPVKVMLEPMSFTLGSHVAIFIAAFVSPVVALFVELGATLGFLLAGFSPVVVLRALSQVLFVVLAAFWLKKQPNLLNKPLGIAAFALVTGVIHALGEIAVSAWFYLGGSIPTQKGFFVTIFLLVGVGTLVHSIVDFVIALLIWKPVQKIVRVPVSARLNWSKQNSLSGSK